MRTTLQPKKANKLGFSLIEIVVAVGIVATVMVALLGMIPTGLNTVNEAADTMSEIRIAQQIIGEIQMTEWTQLDEWEEGSKFYDREGNLMESNEPGKTRYTAQIEIIDVFALPFISPNPYCKRVTVKISNKLGSIDFTENAPRKEYRQFFGVSVMTQSDNDFSRL